MYVTALGHSPLLFLDLGLVIAQRGRRSWWLAWKIRIGSARDPIRGNFRCCFEICRPRLKMENMTTSNVAMAAFLNETVAAQLSSPTGHGAASTAQVFIFGILGVSVALLILFYCGLPMLGFVSTGIVLGSFAAGWMSSIGVVAAGSLFAILQAIAMGGISVGVVMLGIITVVALVVGAFEGIVELLHLWSSGALHIPAWLVGWWDSASAWLPQLWYSGTAWVHHLWDAIPVHHKWKILYT